MKKLNVCKARETKGMIGTLECVIIAMFVLVIVIAGHMLARSYDNNNACAAAGGVMVKSYDGTVCIPTSHTIKLGGS